MAFIYNERLKMKLLVSQDYESLESLTIQWNIKFKTDLYSQIYISPSSTKNGTPLKTFLVEFSEHKIALLQQNDDPIKYWVISAYPCNKEDNIDREAYLKSWICTT